MKIIVRILLGLIAVLVALAIIGQILPRPTPPEVGTIVTLADGQKINTYQKGAGQEIVLIHGLPGSAHDWPELVDSLVAHGFHVTWYDRIGYGHSSRRAPDATHTMQDNGRELDQLITAMGLKNPALVGWSFGGGTVQASKSARSADTPFIVLLAAVGPAVSFEDKPADVPGADIIMRMPILGKLVGNAMISARFDDPVSARWMEGVRSVLLMPGSLNTMSAEMDQMVPVSLDPSDITTPALIIHGRKDKLVEYAVGEDLAARIPGAKLYTLDGAGHMLPMSFPEEIADAIKSFADAQKEVGE